MTDLEKRINEVIAALAPNGIATKMLSGVKKTLHASAHVAESLTNVGDSLQDNIEEGIGGVTGAVGGWIVGKSTNIVGSITGGLISGTLKTVAGIIPDTSDIKTPESDIKVAHCVSTSTIPTDKNELFELLQYTWNGFNVKPSIFGQQTRESFRVLHGKVHSTFLKVAKDDYELLQLAKPFAPKKKFGIF